jgi:hypothetical protein
MCRRLLIVPILATAFASLSSVTASAGGWDSLTFPRDHYLVGQVAHVRQQFFAGELEGTGALTEGPYYAYLLPQRGWRSFEMIEPPIIPAGSVRLGVLEIEGTIVRDGYRYGIASLEFMVPDVPWGRHSIGFCDDPCTHSTVGWLAFGAITIVHTAFEAALLGRIDGQRTTRWTLRNEARKAVRTSNSLRATLGRTQAALREARPATESAVGGSIPVPVPAGPERGGPTLWWPALPAALFGVAAGVLIGRRSRRTKVHRGISVQPVVEQRAIEREHAEV